jgi:drug/metabolite transporter (DMT)-like permease
VTGDLLALLSATFFSIASITIVRGAAPGDDDNGAFVSLLLTTLIAGTGWVILGLTRGFEPVTPVALLWFAGAGVLTAFIGRVFGYATVQHLGAMRASTMKRLNPFFAVALGVGVLGERLTGGMVAGMLLIVVSFVLLVWRGSARRDATPEASLRGRLFNIGYVYGPVSALGYATGYLLRKMGLAAAPDAFLGTAVGTLVAALLFGVAAGFNRRYAAAVRSTFTRPKPWLIAAGVMSSCGQIAYFFALNHKPISRVALIASMEVFITIFLSVIFLRRHETLTVGVAIAAALGIAGTALIFST